MLGHRPMYQGKSINTEFQAAMENLFNKYGVDIYFSGHVHSYERDYPVYILFISFSIHLSIHPSHSSSYIFIATLFFCMIRFIKVS